MFTNPTLESIANRYSCRAYTGKLPSEGQMEAIALAAVQSPSAMNRQPWQIVAVTDGALIAELEAEAIRVLSQQEDKTGYNRVMENGGTIFYGAPAIFFVAVAGDPGVDCGIACQNIALAAHSLGLGNVICGMAGLAFAGEKDGAFRQRLGFPEGYRFGMAVLVGEAAAAREPHQPDTGKIHRVG